MRPDSAHRAHQRRASGPVGLHPRAADHHPGRVERAAEPVHQTVRLERRATVYLAGDRAHTVFRVRDGLVRMTRTTPAGRTVTVRHLLPGDFFGEEALAAGDRCSGAETLTTATLDVIEPDRIQAGLLGPLTRSLSDQMRRLMDDQCRRRTDTLRARVAGYLVLLAGSPLAGTDADGRACLAVTHELVAEGVASTRESVSKVLGELRLEGRIQQAYRRIVVLDDAALAEAAVGADAP